MHDLLYNAEWTDILDWNCFELKLCSVAIYDWIWENPSCTYECTKIEFHFIAYYNSHTHVLSRHYRCCKAINYITKYKE